MQTGFDGLHLFAGRFSILLRTPKPSPMRGRWHGGAVTDEVETPHLRDCAHLISRLAATASPHRGSLWCSVRPRLPLREGGCGAKRSRRMRVREYLQIALQFQQNRHCFPALIRPFGAPSPRGRYWVPANKKTSPQKGAAWQNQTAPSICSKYSKATSCKFDTPVSGGAQQKLVG